jgi:hypothetical protein
LLDFPEDLFETNCDLTGIDCLRPAQVLIITCIDSRVDPAILYGLDIGESFVLRNVANFVHPYQPGQEGHDHGPSSATLFAVTVIKVSRAGAQLEIACIQCFLCLKEAMHAVVDNLSAMASAILSSSRCLFCLQTLVSDQP